MGKFIKDSIMDTALTNLSTSTRLDVTSDSTTPTTLTNTLANATLTSGSFTLANGSSTGRKVTIAQQSDKTITAGGTARHIVLSVGGVIMLTTTCNEQVLTLGNTVTIPAFSYEIGDPT